MDAEKFDKVVLDLLYDELDELTRASAVRHTEQSARAKALYSELRATREVGALPLVEPPPDLTQRILAAEERVRAGRPLRQRLGAMVSILASYTMRPQLGMAALLLLMLGSSLLLLRVKPSEPGNVLVTERGVPESDRESVAIVPIQKGAPVEAPAGPELGDAPVRKQRRAEAPRPEAPPPPAAEPSPAARRDRASAGLADLGEDERTAGAAEKSAAGRGAEVDSLSDDVTQARKGTSCASYEAAASSAPTPEAASEAAWTAAECYAKLGENDGARRLYRSLLGDPVYGVRAHDALTSLPEAVAAKPAGEASPPAAAAKSKAAAPPARPAASPNATAAPEAP